MWPRTKPILPEAHTRKSKNSLFLLSLATIYILDQNGIHIPDSGHMPFVYVVQNETDTSRDTHPQIPEFVFFSLSYTATGLLYQNELDAIYSNPIQLSQCIRTEQMLPANPKHELWLPWHNSIRRMYHSTLIGCRSHIGSERARYPMWHTHANPGIRFPYSRLLPLVHWIRPTSTFPTLAGCYWHNGS